MGEAARALGRASTSDPHDWPLRLAQQALAALLDGGERLGRFRIAFLRASARTRVSALSGDDRGRLERWLALQLATGPMPGASTGLDLLASVEPTLPAAVRAQLPAALLSCGHNLAANPVAPCGRWPGAATLRPIRQSDAGGLPPVDRPSMLSPLFP